MDDTSTAVRIGPGVPIVSVRPQFILSEMSTEMKRHVEEDDSRFGYDSRTNLALATRMSSVDLVHAMRHRHRLTRELPELLRSVDRTVTPTTAITAPSIPETALPDGESNLPIVDALMRSVRLGNLTGLPAISVPACADRSLRPVGIQFMGRPWEEHLLFRLGSVVEAGTPHVAPKVHATALE